MPSQNMSGGTSGTTQPESEYMFVVYDKSSGRIHHIHHVINMPGAEVKGRDQMERTALSYVSSRAKEQATAGLAVLSVPPQQLERGKVHRVDHARQVLVIEREL